MSESVGDAYPREQERCRELIGIYESMQGGVGSFGAAGIRSVLREADEAAISGDLPRMLRAFAAMKGCE